MKIPTTHKPGGWILVAIVLVIFVAVTTVVLVKMAAFKRINFPEPGPNATNQVVETYWTMRSTEYIGQDAEVPAPVTFSLQYGVDKLGAAWVAAGTNLEVIEYPAQEPVIPVLLVADLDNLFVLLYLDTGEIYPLGFGTNDIYPNEPIGWWTPPNQSGNEVVIERTQDFQTWQPVFTNWVLPGSVLTFTDCNVPEDQAFYRLKKP